MSTGDSSDEIDKIFHDAEARAAHKDSPPLRDSYYDKAKAARSTTLKLAGRAAIILQNNGIDHDIKLYKNKHRIPIHLRAALIEIASGWAITSTIPPHPKSAGLKHISSKVLMPDGSLFGISGLVLPEIESEKQVLVDYYYGSMRRIDEDVKRSIDGWGDTISEELRLQSRIADYVVSMGAIIDV